MYSVRRRHVKEPNLQKKFFALAPNCFKDQPAMSSYFRGRFISVVYDYHRLLWMQNGELTFSSLRELTMLSNRFLFSLRRFSLGIHSLKAHATRTTPYGVCDLEQNLSTSRSSVCHDDDDATKAVRGDRFAAHCTARRARCCVCGHSAP